MNQKPVRTKRYPINLKATETNFHDAIEKLRDMHPVVVDILGEDEINVDQANVRIAEALINNVPMLESKRNIHWAVNIQSNKCNVKTEGYVAFGWNCTYELVDGKACIKEVEITFTIFNDDKKLEEFALNNGWEIVKPIQKPRPKYNNNNNRNTR